jgi:hypothetical protein
MRLEVLVGEMSVPIVALECCGEGYRATACSAEKVLQRAATSHEPKEYVGEEAGC